MSLDALLEIELIELSKAQRGVSMKPTNTKWKYCHDGIEVWYSYDGGYTWVYSHKTKRD